ncbi:MAG: hypothetical protein ABL967_17440 [Bryobacteraceae bacterium]
MRVAQKLSLRWLMISGLAMLSLPAHAQDTAAGRALGVVTKIDAESRQLTIKNDAGGEVAVSLDAKASFRRVAPGETNLANASTIAIADVHPGDRVLARGKAGDGGSVAANLIVVMSQADIANKQNVERMDWEKRGVMGLVTEAGADHVMLQFRTLEGLKTLTIIPAKDATIRRYTPDSIKFAEAKASTLAEIKKGDQVRARGDRTPDGAKMSAEEIVSGTFQIVAGLITDIDAANGVIKINNLQTKKAMTVKLVADSSSKKLPPQLAQMIASRVQGTGEEAGGRAGAAAMPGGPGAGVAGGRGGTGGAGGRGGDLQQMFDRAPSITVADLKAGDAIVVSSTVGAASDKITAITLFAGVEPILTKPGSREMALGDWNMGGDIGGFGQ